MKSRRWFISKHNSIGSHLTKSITDLCGSFVNVFCLPKETTPTTEEFMWWFTDCCFCHNSYIHAIVHQVLATVSVTHPTPQKDAWRQKWCLSQSEEKGSGNGLRFLSRSCYWVTPPFTWRGMVTSERIYCLSAQRQGNVRWIISPQWAADGKGCPFKLSIYH